MKVIFHWYEKGILTIACMSTTTKSMVVIYVAYKGIIVTQNLIKTKGGASYIATQF
jgi:hypothetical protein